MTEESDLLLLFGKGAHKMIPVAWKELREKLTEQPTLEEFFHDYQDAPFQYQPEHWYLFLPNSRQWVIRHVDSLSVSQWVWFFGEDEGGGFSDRRLRQILTKAVKWAIEHGVECLTLTFPPCLGAARKPWQNSSARHRRMAWLMRFMSAREAETGLMLGLVKNERKQAHKGN